MAAVNHSGQGDWSASANPPDAPTLTGITAGNSYISTSFTAGGNGGSAITGYQYSLDGGATWLSANGVASPLVISSLANGTSYTVEIRAVNAAGAGPASNTETATPFAAPDTPDATMFVTTSQDGQIGVAWSAPNDNGASISEYTVTLYDASFAGNQVTNCDVSDLTCYDGSSNSVSSTYAISGCTLTNLSCTITGLTNYVTYWVSIQATNAAGSSGRSSPRVPAIPSLVTVSYNANGGTGSISDSTYEIGQPSGITLPTSGVTKYGSVLAGWSTTAGRRHHRGVDALRPAGAGCSRDHVVRHAVRAVDTSTPVHPHATTATATRAGRRRAIRRVPTTRAPARRCSPTRAASSIPATSLRAGTLRPTVLARRTAPGPR